MSEGREKTKEKDSGDDKNSKDKKKNKERKQKDGKKPKKESSLKKIKSKIKSLKETKVNLDKMPWREWLELGKDVLIRFLKHALPGKLEGNIAFELVIRNIQDILQVLRLFFIRSMENIFLYIRILKERCSRPSAGEEEESGWDICLFWLFLY